MKDFGKLLKQAQQVQAKMAEMQEALGEKKIEVSSGGGMVTVIMNGRQELLSVKIDPEVVDPTDVEMLEDLVLAAINEAKAKVEELVKSEMSAITGGMPFPGLFS